MVKWRKEGNYMSTKKTWKENPLYKQSLERVVPKPQVRKVKKKVVRVKKKIKLKSPKVLKVTHAVGSSNLKWDKRYKAMKPGKRISKRGNIYWEYRINRSDIKPKTKL